MEITRRLNICSLILLPLWSQGRQIGVLLLEGDAPYEFSDREIRPYAAVVGQLASAVKSHLVLEQLEKRILERTQELSVANLALQKKIIEHEQTEKALLDSNRHLEAALSQVVAMQEQALQQERMAAVGQLAAGIAHDFNNILTGVLGFSELLLLQQGEISPSARKKVEHIALQGQRAARLIRQILDFSRKSLPHRQRIDLVTTLTQMVELLERTIPENVDISLRVEPGVYPINFDPAQLQQVITNLAVNARDAMPLGGHLNLHLRHFTLQAEDRHLCRDLLPGEWIVLSVSDTGTGIPANILPRIFEPFFTSKAIGEGTGLGLAQVYGIIKQNQGCINVESQEGAGTTFTIYLPVLKEEEGDPIEANKQKKAHPGAGEIILLVDDNPAVREVSQAQLTHLGYRVFAASSGQEALNLFETRQDEIALVLTDLVMPDMSGEALIGHLRERKPDVKVILMTGYPLQAKSRQFSVSETENWLQKPLVISQLAEVLRKTLSYSDPSIKSNK